MKNRRYIAISWLAAGTLMASCAAPSEPSGLKSSGTVAQSETATGNSKLGAATVDYGGALVGDDAMKEKVKACLDTGKFYERRSNPSPKCTEYALAQVSCKSEAITSIMSADQKSQFTTLMAGSLSGYLLDQCMDCSSPTGNTYCEGSGATKQTNPGVRLYLVKDTGGVLDIKTVYIAK